MPNKKPISSGPARVRVDPKRPKRKRKRGKGKSIKQSDFIGVGARVALL